MENLKNSLQNITSESKDLAQDYVKLISLTVSKKIALMIGILVTTFLLSLMFLLVITLCSFAISGFLNNLLNSQFLGFVIVVSFYIVLIAGIIYRIYKTKTPLFSNLFVKILAFIFEIKSERPITLENLAAETKEVKAKIQADKTSITTQLKLLKYVVIETIIEEVIGLFRKKETPPRDEN